MYKKAIVDGEYDKAAAIATKQVIAHGLTIFISSRFLPLFSRIFGISSRLLMLDSTLWLTYWQHSRLGRAIEIVRQKEALQYIGLNRIIAPYCGVLTYAMPDGQSNSNALSSLNTTLQGCCSVSPIAFDSEPLDDLKIDTLNLKLHAK